MPTVRPSDVVRVIADVAAYRAKKREAANLATSTTLAVSLHLPLSDVAHRVAFGLVLNLFVYLVNDLFDVGIDVHAEGRDRARTAFLATHLGAGIAAAAVLLAVAALIAGLHGRELLVVLAINVAIIILYSRWLKRLPVVDMLCMAAWGASMGMVGAPLDSPIALRLLVLLGLLSFVTEGVQVIRDVDTDRVAGVRTTAVVFSAATTVTITRAGIVAAAAYTTIALHWWIGPILLLGLVPPIDTARATVTWDKLRVLFGGSWIALTAWVYTTGRLHPLR